jgi:hypothetical protein
MVFEESARSSSGLRWATYCVAQGLGQHIGAGTPSASAVVEPRAKSNSEVTTILTIIFFMFFSL